MHLMHHWLLVPVWLREMVSSLLLGGRVLVLPLVDQIVLSDVRVVGVVKLHVMALQTVVRIKVVVVDLLRGLHLLLLVH
jgi:hypothetical protein